MEQIHGSTPLHLIPPIQSHQGLFCIHAEVLANKKEGCNPSCPLRNCNRAHFRPLVAPPCANWSNCNGQVLSVQLMLLKPIGISSVYMPKYPHARAELTIHLAHCGIAIKPTVSTSHASVCKTDQTHFDPEQKDRRFRNTNPDLFYIHAEVPADKEKAPNPSCPVRNRHEAVGFIQLCVRATKWTKRHFRSPNEWTDAAETNPDLFCIHAKVPTNKDRAPNPSCPVRNRNKAIQSCIRGQNRPKYIFGPKRME
jgi:hypothetical protein